MQKVLISDVTLRDSDARGVLSFKEKLEIAKKLDRICVDVIETEKIKNTKTDVLFLHTIAPLVKNAIISCPVDYSKESIKQASDALSGAKRKRLHLKVPTSTVQMEYLCGKKPPAVLEMIETLIKECKSLCGDVEFSAVDATRSEREFLYKAISAAIASGANTITVCDTSGEMLPNEFEVFINDLYKSVPELKNVTLSVECSDCLDMASACMISAIFSGVCQVKTNIDGIGMPKLSNIAQIIKNRGDSMNIFSGLKYTELEHIITGLEGKKDNSIFGGFSKSSENENVVLGRNDDINTVRAVVKKMGYDLSEEDISAVYTEFMKVASKKQVTALELDAIIASSAMQTAPTYKLKSYVINSGNVISASAVMTLEKKGVELCGMTIGDGPIDAAFLCIEKIVGRHFELDDFQIQSVTEGREAVGVTIVKLRSGGKLYSGRGISTDIVESGINAYISAINKICFEEV